MSKPVKIEDIREKTDAVARSIGIAMMEKLIPVINTAIQNASARGDYNVNVHLAVSTTEWTIFLRDFADIYQGFVLRDVTPMVAPAGKLFNISWAYSEKKV